MFNEHVKAWKILQRKKYWRKWTLTHKYERTQRNLEWEKRCRERKKQGLVYRLAPGIRLDEHVKIWKELERKRRHNEVCKRSVEKLHDQRQAQWRKWATNNKEKLKQYYIWNRDIIRQREKKRYVENKDKYKKLAKAYYTKNRDKIKITNKEWAIKNPEKTLAIQRNYLAKIAKPWNVSSTAMMCALNSWASTVKKDKKCAICNSSSKYAHHLLHKKYSPDLCLNPNNGMPLCKRCHDEHHCKNLKGMKPLEPIIDIRQYAWVRAR